MPHPAIKQRPNVVTERMYGSRASEEPAPPMKSGIGIGTALSNSFRRVKRSVGLEAPDLGPIQEQIAVKKGINKYLQQRGGKIG